MTKKKIEEYFFMRYINSFYLFEDELKDHKNINYQSPEVYKKWLEVLDDKTENNLKNKINEFVESDKFRCVVHPA